MKLVIDTTTDTEPYSTKRTLRSTPTKNASFGFLVTLIASTACSQIRIVSASRYRVVITPFILVCRRQFKYTLEHEQTLRLPKSLGLTHTQPLLLPLMIFCPKFSITTLIIYVRKSKR